MSHNTKKLQPNTKIKHQEGMSAYFLDPSVLVNSNQIVLILFKQLLCLVKTLARISLILFPLYLFNSHLIPFG